MEKIILTILVALGGYVNDLIKSGLDKLEVAVQANEVATKAFEIVVSAVKDWQPKNPPVE